MFSQLRTVTFVYKFATLCPNEELCKTLNDVTCQL